MKTTIENLDASLLAMWRAYRTAYTYVEHDGSTYWLGRAALPFDTSSIPDTATITGATLKVYVSAKSDGDNDGSDTIRVVQNTAASPTALANGDYDQIGSIDNPTAGASDTDITSISTGAYLSIPLNATGLGWISKTSHTKLGLREGHDATDTAPTSSTGITGIEIRTTDYTGTASDPILEVTYDTGGGGGGGGTTSTTTAYFHGDHLGGMNVMSDGTGQAVLEVADYYPYGAPRISTGSFKEQRKFTGHEYDEESDLTYAKARYYDQDLGKFLSQDPLFQNLGADKRTERVLQDPQLQNSYSYARNNPLTLVDPNGEEPLKSQLGTTQSFERLLQHVDKIYKGESRSEQLNVIRSYASESSSRYIYTTERGWIDAQHFFAAADYTQYAPGITIRIGGFFFEAGQPLLGAEKSSFSYEDLPSNKAGTEFGKLIRGNENSLSEAYKSYMSSIGATVPTDAPNFDTISDTTRVRVEGANFSSDPIKKQDNTKK